MFRCDKKRETKCERDLTILRTGSEKKGYLYSIATNTMDHKQLE
jgi:hypothetical protein